MFKSTRRIRGGVATIAMLVTLVSACGSDDAASSSDMMASSETVAAHDTMAPDTDHSMQDASIDAADRAAAQLATAAFQDVKAADAVGYASTLDTLGCFENAEKGGMGLHYANEALMDATVDITAPEALVYELDAHGTITGLVAHEYIVPLEAWAAAEPPSLFGISFHRHPTLPLWVLHAWLWKDNPTGVFEDWNPAVRLCPDVVPIFGIDLPQAVGPPPIAETGGLAL